MGRKLTSTEFIERSKIVHGDKYDYSLVEYKSLNIRVSIICKEHGEFLQFPTHHIRNQGCKKCANEKLIKTTEQFIIDVKKVHRDKYDYSLVNYINSELKVKIICPIHGIFEQIPNNHLRGHICTECSGKKKSTTIKFIKKSIIIHNNKYDYSLVNYTSANKKVKIICPIHGIFEQIPSSHLLGKGCKKCDNDKKSLTNLEFITRSINIHGSKYDYSLVNYTNIYTNIDIICKKHGIFNQRPEHHMNGNGCPKCKESRGELKISKLLDEFNIKYVKQKKFNDCIDKRQLPFDFHLPNLNVCIEFDGLHHFEPINTWKGEIGLMDIKLKDEIKNKYCQDNNINLIRIKYDENIKEKLNNLIKKQ